MTHVLLVVRDTDYQLQRQGAHRTAPRTPVNGRRSRAPLKRDLGIGCAGQYIKILQVSEIKA